MLFVAGLGLAGAFPASVAGQADDAVAQRLERAMERELKDFTAEVMRLGYMVRQQARARSSGPATGIKISFQPWTPLNDADQPVVAFDNDTFLSDMVETAWEAHSGDLRTLVVEALGKGDLIADGVTLYGIELELERPEVVVTEFTGEGTGASPFVATVTVRVRDAAMNARATTPDLPLVEAGVTRAADPACRVELDFDLTMTIGITNDLDKPFFSPMAGREAEIRNAAPAIAIGRVRAAGRNLTCAIPVLAVNAFQQLLPRAFNNLVAYGNAELSDRLREVTATMTAETVDRVNALIKPQVDAYRKLYSDPVINDPSLGLTAKERAALVQLLDQVSERFTLQAWRLQNGDATKLVLNIAPLGPFPAVPLPPPGVFLAGPMTQGPGYGGATEPFRCDDIRLEAARKTGPRRMIAPGGTLGPDPLQRLPVTIACRRLLDGLQVYQMAPLSFLYPTQLDFQVIGNCEGARLIDRGVQAEIDHRGWTTSARFRATELLAPHAVRAQRANVPCGSAVARFDPRKLPHLRFDPAIRWPELRGNVIEQVGINPQPLPPRIPRPSDLRPAEQFVSRQQQVSPVATRTLQGDGGDTDQFCAAYADDAAAKAAEGARSCGLGGPRYTRARADHLNWCRGADRSAVDSERAARDRELAACGRCNAYADATIAQFERANSCASALPRSGFWIPNSREAHFNFCFVPGANGERRTNPDIDTHGATRNRDLAICARPPLR